MTLEERDLSLLIALQENPLAPASKLAKVIGQSTPTVISRLNILKESGSYYYTSADLKPEALNLEIIDVLIQINKFENINFFEKKICYNHPYTLFRIRCLGKINGIYVQFRIPIDSKKFMIELFNHLKKNNRILDYKIINIKQQASAIYTDANLASWEPNLMRWKFNWENWFKQLDKQPSKIITQKSEKSHIENFDELDVALLEEITKDARRKNTEIISSLKLDKNSIGLPQRISRKLKFLNEKIVFQHRVFLQWETFEIFNSFLINCKCTEETSYRLQNLLEKKPIPFQSTYKVTDEGFLWYVRCPATHFSNISEIVLKISEEVEFYVLDYKNSAFYGLWKGAFNNQSKEWRLELMKKEEVLK